MNGIWTRNTLEEHEARSWLINESFYKYLALVFPEEVISDNFYAGSLTAFRRNAGNRLVLKNGGLLQVDSGAEFIPVDHENNLQSSQAFWLEVFACECMKHGSPDELFWSSCENLLEQN